jgi:hypothetical protein
MDDDIAWQAEEGKGIPMSQRSRTCEPNLFYLVIEFYRNALCTYIQHLVEFKIVNISYNAVFVF